jgi:hypothetical protein
MATNKMKIIQNSYKNKKIIMKYLKKSNKF